MLPEKYYLIFDYQPMELLGVNGLFTNLRVDRYSLPEGFYKYSIREGDDDPFSTVEKDVWVNHMGDFICKKELDLNGQDEYDLFDDYSFTDEAVDLDKFFGVDIKQKIACELESFYYDFDTYDYHDQVPAGASREDVIEGIKDGLADKAYVKGMIQFFENVLSDNKDEDRLDDASIQKIHAFIGVLSEINSHNRDALDIIVESATKIRDEQAQKAQGKEPEIQ